ncbi:HprK-related kinase A [Ferribacterium limneticum]|uniref:HprK-related kinase A n=1 Tax=Ferribacterium limneticum TaxID=76259 RepID=UPI001CFC2C2D|nr:HprK-related kinase A [Ferribacterium limneticum]UCV17294.1 HprK-related kinase A [Ferribacterium limneticum]
MKLGDLDQGEVGAMLMADGVYLRMSPFVARIQSDIPVIRDSLREMYSDFPLADAQSFTDFQVRVSYEPGIRKWISPLVRFYFDGRPSFTPLPAHQAFAMLEWGLNWCVAAHAHQYLIVHAAVVERNGRAFVFPAPPGSGKSTLCAALVNRGWRLLSDELGLIDMETSTVLGMARAVNLKNNSIEIIKRYAPDVRFTSVVPDTTKGTIALMQPPTESVLRAGEPGRPCCFILPKYSPETDIRLDPYSKARTCMLLAEQSFNYHVHGLRGFETFSSLVAAAKCFSLTYSRLDDAVSLLNDLSENL